MAPVLWGLDLAEIHWSKFKSSYMWNRDYHRRRTKFIVYQLALIFCVVSESLGTAALSDYIDQQAFVQSQDSRAYVFNNDYVGAASYNIFAGIFVAFVWGAAFFFDLFWPRRSESRSVRIAWKVCGVLGVIFYLAAALTLTVVTARHEGFATGISQRRANAILSQWHKDGGTPLIYRRNGRAVAAVVFAWLGWFSVVPSCVLLFQSIDYVENGPGPLSKHGREKEGTKTSYPEQDFVEKDPTVPSPDQQHAASTPAGPAAGNQTLKGHEAVHAGPAASEQREAVNHPGE